MAITHDPEQRAAEEALEWQRLERDHEEAARRRDHEYRLQKLEIVSRENKKVQKLIVQMPTKIACIWAVTILTLFKRQVPPALEHLLSE